MFKVGEVVGVARSTSYGFQSVSYATVVKVNGYGHIFLDNGKKFDKHGREYNCTYGMGLFDAETVRKSVAIKEERDARRNNVKRLISLLEGSFSYSGTVHISDEQRLEIQELVAKI